MSPACLTSISHSGVPTCKPCIDSLAFQLRKACSKLALNYIGSAFVSGTCKTTNECTAARPLVYKMQVTKNQFSTFQAWDPWRLVTTKALANYSAKGGKCSIHTKVGCWSEHWSAYHGTEGRCGCESILQYLVCDVQQCDRTTARDINKIPCFW